MNWLPHAEGHWCKRHEIAFRIGETCDKCVVDPGDFDIGQTSADIDVEINALAQQFGARARRMWRECETLLNQKTAIDKNVAVKMSAEAAKWERLALEAKDKISARKHLREAMAHERDMSSQRGTH